MTLTQFLAVGMIIVAAPAVPITLWHMMFTVENLTAGYNTALGLLVGGGGGVWWLNSKRENDR